MLRMYVGLLASWMTVLHGASLSVVTSSATSGSTAAVAVQLSADGDRVSALQFDLTHDASLGMSITGGGTTAVAGKSIFVGQVAPGHLRILVAGLNSSVLEDGVVASLSLFAVASTATGNSAVDVGSAVASDPSGQRVELTTGSGGNVVLGASANLPTVGVFPHMASGGGWKTSFTLLNLTSTARTARLNFWDDQGAPLILPVTFPSEPALSAQTASVVEVLVPAEGLVVVETAALPDSPLAVGSAELQASTGITGSATFSHQLETGTSAEASVLLETRQPASFVQPFDNTQGFATGVAVANMSGSAPANIQVIARDNLGRLLFTDAIALAPHGHGAFSLVERYLDLDGQRGTLEFLNQNGSAIAVLGLRFNGNGAFTSVPAATR